MRLWHKDLIHILPRQQLLGQWRECCLIAKNILEKGTPNHILVDKVMDYPLKHFVKYGREVFLELNARRDYHCNYERFGKYFKHPSEGWGLSLTDIFPGWHNKRYLVQCLYNLQEKADCGAIPFDEWLKIIDLYSFLKEKSYNYSKGSGLDYVVGEGW